MASNNLYKDIMAVYDAKNAYGSATDDAERKRLRQKADSIREKIAGYGYKTVAEAIGADNADASTTLGIAKKYGKMGKVPVRQYLTEGLVGRGMTREAADAAITWDEDTGEVLLGATKIGTPDAVIDGVSYMGDTSALDNSINDFVSRNGITNSNKNTVSQQNQNLIDKYNKLLEIYTNENAFETEEGKSILSRYDTKALEARDNAVAEGAASNGGNIDSFSAANAARQQAAYRSMGEDKALEAHQQKINNILNILSALGVRTDTIYQQGETTKLNDANVANTEKTTNAEIDAATSASTGYITDGQIREMYGQYWNDDGSVKNIDNIQEIIDVKEKEYYSETDSQLKEGIRMNLRALELARNDKIDQNGLSYKKTSNWQQAVPNAEVKADVRANDTALQVSGAEAASLIAEQTQEDLKKQNETNLKAMDAVVDNINAAYKSNTGGKEEGVDVLIKNGDGNYKFNPAVGRAWYLDPVIKYILTSGLSEDLINQMFASIDVTPEEVKKVHGYLD